MGEFYRGRKRLPLLQVLWFCGLHVGLGWFVVISNYDLSFYVTRFHNKYFWPEIYSKHV